MEKDGRLLIGFSPTIGNFEILEGYLKKSGFSFKIVKKKVAKYGPPLGDIKLEIIEARLL